MSCIFLRSKQTHRGLGQLRADLAAYTGADIRLPLGKRANTAAAAQMRAEMGEMIEDVEMDVRDDDEEMREWEEAQIRRAGGAREVEKADRKDEGRTGVYRPAPSTSAANSSSYHDRTNALSAVPQTSTLPSLASTTSRLAAMLSTLTTSHQLDSSSLAHFEKERQDLDTQEKELREEVQKVEKKSRWFDEFKEEVEDWGAFLDEKVRSNGCLTCCPPSGRRKLMEASIAYTVSATREDRVRIPRHPAGTVRHRFTSTICGRRRRRRALHRR